MEATAEEDTIWLLVLLAVLTLLALETKYPDFSLISILNLTALVTWSFITKKNILVSGE